MNESKNNKFRLSIVYKLNTKVFFRTVLLLLVLDVFLVASTALVLIFQTERTIAEATVQVNESGLPDQRSAEWIALSDCKIEELSDAPRGFRLLEPIKVLFPLSTKEGYRSFDQKTLEYRIDFLPDPTDLSDSGEHSFGVVVSLKSTLLLLKKGFLALAIFELLLLLKSLLSGARMIRRTLQPIADLASVTQSLSAEGPSFATDKMERFADKLATINPTKLDTRISLEDTQDELQGLAIAINSLLDRINESYRSQIRFVSDASHELRTPISVIQGYANLLDRWGKNDPVTLQESLDAIKEETANMKSLVEQLLFLARGETNTMALQMEEIPLADLIEEILKETQMIDSGHHFTANTSPASVLGDKALVKQALRILIDNSIQYTNPGGEIKLSVDSNESFVKLIVKDNGIGIPGEAVPRVFDRFYRTDESRSRASGGTGLGLSIAKWIAERHGGYMEVLSRQNVGTRITIALPRLESPNDGDRPTSQEGLQPYPSPQL